MKIKSKILVGLIAVIFAGCAFFTVKPVQECVVDMPDGTTMTLTEFCTTPGRDSTICELNNWEDPEEGFDPCVIHRGLEIVSKEILVMEGYTAEQFEADVNAIKEKVIAGGTLGDAKYWLASYLIKFNRIAGSQILILSDLFLELPQNQFLKEDDKILIISSLDDLIAEVKRLAVWL